MSEPIQVGDLVMLVRGHPCVYESSHYGVPYRVVEIIQPTGGGWHCSRCGEYDMHWGELAARLWHTGDGNGMPLSCLKRIPPLDELEGVKTEEGIHEPA